MPLISKPDELVLVSFDDNGDSVPAYDANGNAFEAWTSHFKTSNGLEFYTQVGKTGNGGDEELREKTDRATLIEYDLNIDAAEVLIEGFV